MLCWQNSSAKKWERSGGPNPPSNLTTKESWESKLRAKMNHENAQISEINPEKPYLQGKLRVAYLAS